MATINIGPYTATVTNNNNSFNGTLEPIAYQVGGIDILRLAAADAPNQGASVTGSYSPWSATISGKLSLLEGQYSESFNAQASQTGFDVPLPTKRLTLADGPTGEVKLAVTGRLKLVNDALSLILSPVVTLPIVSMGISVSVKCQYTEVTTIDVGSLSMSKSFSASASLFGVKVSSPTVTVTVEASTLANIASNVYSALIDQIEDVIEDYLLAWANELANMTVKVASYIEDFGEQIIDTLEDIFGGGSSSGPPPPFLINTFAASMELGSGCMVQFGQALSTSNSAESFMFPDAFGGSCRAVLLNAARPNVWSGLSVGSRASDNFAIDRDNAIGYHVPFHWIAFGPASGANMNESGFTDIGDVRIQWGRATSSVDGDQTFNLAGKFGSGPVAVVVNTDSAGIRSALSLASIDAAAGSFVVNRDDAIDGNVNFTYLAIGPVPGRSLSEGVLRYEGLTIQWGRANSSTDGEQLIQLPASFTSMNFSVVTSVLQASVQSALSLSRAIHEACFIVNRDGRIDGVVPFNWIAVGW